jgi:hypothetical protein
MASLYLASLYLASRTVEMGMMVVELENRD